MQLDAKLPDDVRESVAQAFRELLIERGRVGRTARPDADGADFVPSHEADAAVSHRGSRAKGSTSIASRMPRSATPTTIRSSHDRVREDLGLRPGGLGLVMTRALVDEVIYNEKRNEVVLVKYLD